MFETGPPGILARRRRASLTSAKIYQMLEEKDLETPRPAMCLPDASVRPPFVRDTALLL